MGSRTKKGDISSFDDEEQHPHNNFSFSGEPFHSVDDSTGNEIQPRQSHSSAGKLFVGGISWETTKESFGNYFRKYGEVVEFVIMMDKNSGRSRGFGFVTFADSSIIDTVLGQEHVIDGRVVEVKRTVPREDMARERCVQRSDTPLIGVPRSNKIFVGGIPPSLSEDEFKDYFSFYGIIVEQQILFDYNTGRSRGFGFVTFENEEAVEKVLSRGKTHELGGKQVEIKKAIPKRESDAQTHRRGGGGGGYVSKSYNSFNHGYDRHGGNSSELGSYGGYENFWGGGYGGVAASFNGGYSYGYGYGPFPMYNAGVYGGGGGYFNPMGSVGTRINGGGYYGNRGGGGFVNGDANGEGRYHPYRK